MNNWAIIGVICFCIAVILLLAGVGLGFEATAAYDQLSPYLGSYGYQLKNQAFMAVATPYLVGAAIMFVIGVVGIFAGNSKTADSVSVNPPAVLNASVIQAVKCPSCGQNMVFNAEKQRWYCQKENFYL